MLLEKISRIPNTTDAFRLEFENGTKMKCFVENVADFSLASGMELDGERYTALLEAVAFSRTRGLMLPRFVILLWSRGCNIPWLIMIET